MKNKNKYEIIIHGRGGQGAKTTAEIIAQAVNREGKHVQAFPRFGPERTGAPVEAFVRISDEIIRTHQPIIEPECVLVLDESLLGAIEISDVLKDKMTLIVNTKKAENEIREKLKLHSKIITIDASEMAKKIIGENRPNVVMLGKFSKITNEVAVENITGAFEDKFITKLGEEKTAQNVKAIETAYTLG